jgi:hypothetical protein
LAGRSRSGVIVSFSMTRLRTFGNTPATLARQVASGSAARATAGSTAKTNKTKNFLTMTETSPAGWRSSRAACSPIADIQAGFRIEPAGQVAFLFKINSIFSR